MRNVESSALLRPMVVQRGTLSDRPWSATLAAIGLVGRSGQLTLRADDGKLYQLAFAQGLLVGASSPLPVDAIARIALSSQLVSPAAVATATRILGRSDDVERFAETAGLAPAHVQHLKRRVLVQRAARTFAVERGKYTVDDKLTIPVIAGVLVDIRAAIYQGMRLNLSQQRLTGDLRQLGSRFVLRPEAVAELGRYDFGEDAQPILDALHAGTSIPELEALHRELDPRMIAAVLGALASCDAVAPISAQEISMARTPTPREPTISRLPTPREPTISPTISRLPTPRSPSVSSGIPIEITQGPPRGPFITRRAPATPRVDTRRSLTDPFLEAQPTTMRPPALSLPEVQQLIASRVGLLERGADHFTFLGVPFGASVSQVREAYLELARYLRPEKLTELGIRDASYEARSVFAQAVIAFTVLTDSARRAEYLTTIRHRRGG